MKWYESARIHFGWVRYGEELTPSYAHQIVKKTLDMGANTLAFCVQVGGYALWESEVTPREKELGEFDLIGALAKLCKQHDLFLVPWWLGTAPGTARVLREHPSWQQVGPLQNGNPPQRYNFVCYNSPYRELLYEEIREIVSKYGPDGIYFNQLPASCYCPWCKTKYERTFGKPMPIIREEPSIFRFAKRLPPQLKTFREESIRSFCKGIRRILDEIKPDTCYIQDWLWDFQSELAIGPVDVALPEFYQSDDMTALGEKCRLTKAYFGHGPIWSNVRHAVDHDARHHPLRATQLILANCVSNMASPLLSEQDAMDFDRSGIEDLAGTFDYIAQVQGLISGAEPVRYAALLHSKPTHDRFPERFEEAFGGLYRLLCKSHIPFEIVTEADVLNGSLDSYKTLVLPDVAILSNEVATAIGSLVDRGIGLVATHMTGLLDENANLRATPALSEIFGYLFNDVIAYDTADGIWRDPTLDIADLHSYLYIWHYGSLRETKTFTKDSNEDRLFGVLGGFVRSRVLEGAQVIADIHTHDQIRMNARSYNRRGLYPGPPRWPLAILNNHGSARTAYFTAQVEAEWRRAHAPQLSQLMAEAVLWTGGAPPFRVENFPWSTDIRSFHHTQTRMQSILIVNLTTDPPKDLGRGPGVFESVTPLSDLKIVLPSVGEVKTVKGIVNEAKFLQEGEMLHIEIPTLDLYETVVVEYE